MSLRIDYLYAIASGTIWFLPITLLINPAQGAEDEQIRLHLMRATAEIGRNCAKIKEEL